MRPGDAYVAYNTRLPSGSRGVAAAGATVVVNDYHLSLVGSELARLRPDLQHGALRPHALCHPGGAERVALRGGRALIRGLCSFGAVGFHTALWRDRFLAWHRSGLRRFR